MISRDRQRQEQKPREKLPPRKTVHGDEPGRAGADHERRSTDTQHQQEGVAAGAGEDVTDEVGPSVSARAERDHAHGRERQNGDDRNQKRSRDPAENAVSGSSFMARGRPSPSLVRWRLAVRGVRLPPLACQCRALALVTFVVTGSRHHGLRRKELLGLLHGVGKGICRVDHRLHEVDPVSAKAQARMAGQR